VILRGIGLGGWMLQEPYMLNMSSFVKTQHGIKSKIQGLIGTHNTDTFYTAWLADHMRKIDVDSLAAFGFNSIRLPMHYNLFTLSIQDEPVPGQNTWLTEGFELVDSLLAWCTENHVYLILDLHAAPGGQGHDSAICDYDARYPSLWEDTNNRSKTVSLWKKLAERYKNEEWIGGYDLINETNWTLPSNNLLLKNLYVEITDSIRDVDTNHIIFIEGNWFANDFTGLTPPWDNNMAYSFHKYWSYNNQSSIQWALNIRNTYNVPLWCGEAGENSNTWYTDAISLFETNKIGWAWWPWKKFSSICGIASIDQTADYNTLLNYWNNGGTEPSVTFAKNALMEMTVNLKLENCAINRSVIDAMFRQPFSSAIVPYADLQIPGTIYASDYDYGRNGYAYYDLDVANYSVSSGINTDWNDGWVYRNDGVDVQTCNDNTNSNGYNVGWMETGEWIDYTVSSQSAGSSIVSLRVAGGNSGGILEFQSVDDAGTGTAIGDIAIPNTGGWQSWTTVSGTIPVAEGKQTLRVYVKNSGYNLEWMSFGAPSPVAVPSIVTDNQVQLYPDPCDNQLNIVFPENKNYIGKIQIHDISGKLITTNKLFVLNNNTYTIDVSELDEGLYFIKIFTEDVNLTSKFIIKR
jgi:hypothetical protein